MAKIEGKPLVEGDVKIIYENGKPHGIRDRTGFLFFFTAIPHFSGQDERYRQEIEQQYRLADYLLKKLQLVSTSARSAGER